MKSNIFLMILLQILLIALNAVFAAAEIAVLSVNENKLNKLAEDGNRRARRLLKLTKQPAKFLATIQVAITLAGFLGSAFAADNFAGPIVNALMKKGADAYVSESTMNTIAVVSGLPCASPNRWRWAYRECFGRSVRCLPRWSGC